MASDIVSHNLGVLLLELAPVALSRNIWLIFPPSFQVTKALLSAGPKFEVFALVRSEERAAKALGSEANQVERHVLS